MHDQMTQSQQVKWIFAETARQILVVVPAAWETIMEAIYDFRARRVQNRRIRNLLERLTDETLLDRLAMAPTHIPVTAEDEPVSIPVRIKTVIRRLSIDGMVAR